MNIYYLLLLSMNISLRCYCFITQYHSLFQILHLINVSDLSITKHYRLKDPKDFFTGPLVGNQEEILNSEVLT